MVKSVVVSNNEPTNMLSLYTQQKNPIANKLRDHEAASSSLAASTKTKIRHWAVFCFGQAELRVAPCGRFLLSSHYICIIVTIYFLVVRIFYIEFDTKRYGNNPETGLFPLFVILYGLDVMPKNRIATVR